MKLEYYVLKERNGKIIRYNILEGWEKIIKKLKKKVKNKYDLKELLEKEFKYYYWGRTESEILVGSIFNFNNEFKKIDIWYQIELNLEVIVDYIWSKMEE